MRRNSNSSLVFQFVVLFQVLQPSLYNSFYLRFFYILLYNQGEFQYTYHRAKTIASCELDSCSFVVTEPED